MQCSLLGCWVEWRIMCSELSFLGAKDSSKRDVDRCDSFKLNFKPQFYVKLHMNSRQWPWKRAGVPLWW